MRTPCIDMRNIQTISQKQKLYERIAKSLLSARRGQSVPRPAFGDAMLTLLRPPF
jgi:hypothetical protein